MAAPNQTMTRPHHETAKVPAAAAEAAAEEEDFLRTSSLEH
jgi:hypothetical protein